MKKKKQSTRLTPQEIEFARILSDPVEFAKVHFGWEARWYQAEMLRDQSFRKVSRCGRRVGKSDVLCVHIVWYAFTHQKARLLIATPYETQVKLLFRRIREFIKLSPEIQQAVVRDRQNPEYIELGNGTTIQGFTAGTKSGSEGGSLRGQSADWIYLDETDYLSEGDITAITTIAAERPDIGIWASSTPTGKRGSFYNWCMDAQDGALEVEPGIYKGSQWTAFYFPSTCNPNWNEDMEREWRTSLTEEAYQHEIMANFGQETIGVFNKQFIDRAKRPYIYDEKPDYKALRVIGVDWDKYQTTPQIVVLEYDPDEVNSRGEKGMFRVINRDTVPRSQFTLDNAVQKIVQFNGIYRPEYIYMDRGFGEYQLEILHKKGKECSDPKEPEYGLDRIVKGVSFSSKIDIRDPGTGMPERKDIKPFMVNQTVILLDRDRLIINENDRMLWRQMENYQVVRIANDGRPTYTSVNEHALDALMLAVLAMTKEFPQVTKIIETFQPTKVMAIAPTLRTSEPNFDKPKEQDERAKERFFSKGMAAHNTKTWFKVDDLKVALDNRRNYGVSRNIVAKRGRGSRNRPYSRPKF